MDVVSYQAEAFKVMMADLQWGPPEFIKFMKMTLIKDYPGNSFILNMDFNPGQKESAQPKPADPTQPAAAPATPAAAAGGSASDPVKPKTDPGK